MDLVADLVNAGGVLVDEFLTVIVIGGAGEVDFKDVLPVNPGPKEPYAPHREHKDFEDAPCEHGDFKGVLNHCFKNK